MINLKEVYGKRYKIEVDPSWDAETTENRTWFRQHGEEPYYFELVGKYGRLYNQSDTHLQMWVSGRLGVKLSKNIPVGWVQIQGCSEGYGFKLPNSDISQAFSWIKPRKKRVGNTSPENLARLRAHGFKSKPQNPTA